MEMKHNILSNSSGELLVCLGSSIPSILASRLGYERRRNGGSKKKQSLKRFQMEMPLNPTKSVLDLSLLHFIDGRSLLG